MSATEVCALLDVSPENQRVLMHRGRSRLRAVLAEYLDDHQVEWMSTHEITCQLFVELVTEYFEGALADRTSRWRSI